jgi:para-nitrobenzyl esterase
MRSKSVDEVFDAGGGLHTRQMGWNSIIDGKTIPGQIPALLSSGRFYRVPIISGVDNRESGFFLQWRLLNGADPWGAEDYAAYLAGRSHSDALARAYPLDAFPSPDLAWVSVESDDTICRTVSFAEQAARHTNVYFYDFNDPGAAATIFDSALVPSGAFHATDIPYLFGRGYPNEQKPEKPQWTPEQQHLSDRLQDYTDSFLRGGSPAAGGNQWPGMSAGIRYLTPAGDRTEPLAIFRQEHNCAIFEKDRGK